MRITADRKQFLTLWVFGQHTSLVPPDMTPIDASVNTWLKWRRPSQHGRYHESGFQYQTAGKFQGSGYYSYNGNDPSLCLCQVSSGYTARPVYHLISLYYHCSGSTFHLLDWIRMEGNRKQRLPPPKRSALKPSLKSHICSISTAVAQSLHI